jgi:DNA-binding beta-propeller fold protein YncE
MLQPRLRAIAALCVVLALAACAPSDRTVEQLEAPLVWPPAPAAPRITFLNAFSRPEDLGISRGFFQRMADAVFGKTESRLIRPMAIVGVDGVLYVADPGARGVHRFHPASGSYDLIRAEGDLPLPSPVGLARGAEGEVYVADSALGRVFVIRRGATAAIPVALGASMRQPTGIAFDPATGRLFVVDTAAHRVNVFNRDGTLAHSFGRRGSGDGEFNYPTLLCRTPQGRLYLTDSLNFRVQILDEQGRFIGKFGRIGDGTGDLARHKGIATDRQGHIYVVDALFHSVQVFDESGSLLLSVGALGRDRGEFWLPTGIFISEDDTIYVADSYNQRVQVFRYIGGPL